MEDPRTVNPQSMPTPPDGKQGEEIPFLPNYAEVKDLAAEARELLDRLRERLNNLERQNHRLRRRVAELEQALQRAVQELQRMEEQVAQTLLYNDVGKE